MSGKAKDLKKVGIYVDEDIWKKMKEYTFKKHGTTRELSGEVRKLIEANLPFRILKEGAEELEIPAKRMSEAEVREGRPKMPTSSSGIIREMRAQS